MIEEGFFSHLLKPLLKKKREKETIQEVLEKYFKPVPEFSINGSKIKIQKLSVIQKREYMLIKEDIENSIENSLSRKYIIMF